ncbi:MAG: hypothetical protein ACFFAE_21745 [Candidatus Hodarchaeota archaeon]
MIICQVGDQVGDKQRNIVNNTWKFARIELTGTLWREKLVIIVKRRISIIVSSFIIVVFQKVKTYQEALLQQ